MKRIAILLIASAAVCAAPALAEDVVIKKSPDVTVGSDTVVKEREVVREREPRSKVIVKEKHDEPVVEKKTIIKERD